MQDIFFGIGRFLQATFDYLLVPFEGFAHWVIALVLAFGAIYWLMVQAKLSRKATESGGMK